MESMIKRDIEGATDHLLDAAPVERGYLETALTAVLSATGNMELYKEVESAALQYARMAAERAYELGVYLGRQDRFAELVSLAGLSAADRLRVQQLVERLQRDTVLP